MLRRSAILSAVTGSGRDCLKSLVNHLEVDFAQFVFFHGGTPDKSRIGNPATE
jgi:hypothetical protein